MVLGIDPLAAVVALVAIVAALFFLSGAGGSSGGESSATPDVNSYPIELRPEHVKYMKEKEEEWCSGTFGKGLRCIFDFLREESDESVKTILAEKPKYTEGFEPNMIFVHPPQLDWFAEKGIKISTENGEEYKELSRVSRACFDWAMRQEAEGNSQDKTLFEEMRCLNC